MFKIVSLSFTLQICVFSFSQVDEDIVFPKKWWFNSSKKKALELNYGFFNYHPTFNNFHSFRNVEALSISFQDYYKFSKKRQSVRDDIFRFSYFLPLTLKEGSTNWVRNGWQCSGTGGWDIFGWSLFDLTPNYGWAFGNRKFSITDSLNSAKKIKNPFFGICLGIDAKMNAYIKNHGFAIGTYVNTFFDISRKSWKNKSDFSGMMPEDSKFHNLQIGLSLQYILRNLN